MLSRAAEIAAAAGAAMGMYTEQHSQTATGLAESACQKESISCNAKNNEATNQPINQATNQSSNQSIKQPSNQATEQPSNQAT